MERMQTTNSAQEADPTGRRAGDDGAKLDDGKLPIGRGLIDYFPNALTAVAEVSQAGHAKGYAWASWRTVPEGVTRYSDALGRHMLREAGGHCFDDGPGGTGLRHAALLAWNALARLELIIMRDNTPMTATECITGFRGVVLDKAIQEGLARERHKKQGDVQADVDRLRARAAAYQNFDGKPHDVLDGVCLRCGHPTDRKCRCTGG